MNLEEKYAEQIFEDCGYGTSVSNIMCMLNSYKNDFLANRCLTQLIEIAHRDITLTKDERIKMVSFLDGMKK